MRKFYRVLSPRPGSKSIGLYFFLSFIIYFGGLPVWVNFVVVVKWVLVTYYSELIRDGYG